MLALTQLIDLRAVLELQPSNAEALAEIHSLCPSDPAPAATSASASSSSSAQPSCSSSSSASASHSSSALYHWIPPPSALRPLPFPRSQTDDRKLKISSIPITVEIPEELDLPFFTTTNGVPDKTQARPPKRQEPVRMINQAFSYPCWERYMVQRVSE